MRRAVLLLSLLLLSGCGPDEVEERARELQARAEARAERVRDRVEEVRDDAEKVGRRTAKRVREVLRDLEQAVPEAGPQAVPPRREGGKTVEDFLAEVLEDVDTYWETTLAAAGRPTPQVRYDFVAPNRFARTACRTLADDRAAFYCPADDTIYIGQRIALEVYNGVAQGFPGEAAGEGRAVGDFGVAYLVAHEYAHNVQHELGLFTVSRSSEGAKPFELQADCMAGLWANSVYRAGRVKEGDVEEAISTALAVGDFEVESEEHHGTPAERRRAWVLGYDSGEPAVCENFVRV
jgi:predicted metalloprotease